MVHKPYIAISISIVAVSFAAIFIKFCEPTPPLTIAFYRLLFTTLLVFPLVAFRKQTRTELCSIPKKSMVAMILIGCILAAHFALWITSISKTSIASSVLLVTAHPILVAPLSYYFLKEHLTKLNAIGITLSFSGVIILVYGNYGFSSFSIDTLEGNILAMLGGIAAGLYILGGRLLRKTVSIFTYAFIVYSIGTIVLFILCIIYHIPLLGIQPQYYLIIFIMALLSGIFGHTLYNWSLEYIKASVASVFLLGEPIGSSILAYVIPSINQQPSLFTLFGGCVILTGIYLTTRKKKENKKLKGIVDL